MKVPSIQLKIEDLPKNFDRVITPNVIVTTYNDKITCSYSCRFFEGDSEVRYCRLFDSYLDSSSEWGVRFGLRCGACIEAEVTK